MIIIHEGKIVNKAGDTIVIVFANDEERKTFGNQIANMPEREGIRAYASFANGKDGMEIITQAIKQFDPNFKI